MCLAQPMSDEGSKVIRSVHPAPLATICTCVERLVPLDKHQHRNGVISVNGISLPVLVRRGNHLRVFAKKFSIVVDIGTGVG